ncbi:MAG TPA: POTRA domain-containing protein, partial [Bacteroidota bacterium]
MKKHFLIACCSIAQVSGLSAQTGNGDSIILVRSIRIEGNETTKEFVIRREMKTAPGDTLDARRLTHDEERIYSLGLFNRVGIEPVVVGNQADLLVRVHERWYLYPFPVLGFKYRDFNNLYYGIGVIHNNFRGRNERLIFSVAFGFDRWIQLTYRNPKLTAGDDISLGISVS